MFPRKQTPTAPSVPTSRSPVPWTVLDDPALLLRVARAATECPSLNEVPDALTIGIVKGHPKKNHNGHALLIKTMDIDTGQHVRTTAVPFFIRANGQVVLRWDCQSRYCHQRMKSGNAGVWLGKVESHLHICFNLPDALHWFAMTGKPVLYLRRQKDLYQMTIAWWLRIRFTMLLPSRRALMVVAISDFCRDAGGRRVDGYAKAETFGTRRHCPIPERHYTADQMLNLSTMLPKGRQAAKGGTQT